MGVTGSKLEKALGEQFPDGERYFGLENFGNTCYCNSVLQALYFCVPFREELLEYDLNNKSLDLSGSDENILTCLAELFSQINSQKKRTGVIAPRRFVHRVRRENEIFRGYMHQDAHEFLNFLLNELVNILEKESPGESSELQPSPIESARILVIHLKRFKYMEQRHRKLSYRVVFPLELKLSNTVENVESEYSLFAVVVHVGSGPNHGHYVSLVKSHNHWLFFDDENVEIVDESAIHSFFGSDQECSTNTDHGYILFYQSVASSSSQARLGSARLAYRAFLILELSSFSLSSESSSILNELSRAHEQLVYFNSLYTLNT